MNKKLFEFVAGYCCASLTAISIILYTAICTEIEYRLVPYIAIVVFFLAAAAKFGFEYVWAELEAILKS